MSRSSREGVVQLLRVLGLEPPVKWNEVEQRRKTLVKVWHPDRFQSDAALQAEAHQQLSRINVAFSELTELHRSGERWWESHSGPAAPIPDVQPAAPYRSRKGADAAATRYPLPSATRERLEVLLSRAKKTKTGLGGATTKAKKFLIGAVGAAVVLKVMGVRGLIGFTLLGAMVLGFTMMGLAGRNERRAISKMLDSDLQCTSCGCRLIEDYVRGAESQLDCLIATSEDVLNNGVCPNCGERFAG